MSKNAYTAAVMGAPGEIEEIFAAYRDGKKFGEIAVSEFKLNPGLPAAAYQKPN